MLHNKKISLPESSLKYLSSLFIYPVRTEQQSLVKNAGLHCSHPLDFLNGSKDDTLARFSKVLSPMMASEKAKSLLSLRKSVCVCVSTFVCLCF